MESVKGLFRRPEQGLSITAVDEKSIIIVKELEENEGYEEMDKLAQTILDTLGLEKERIPHMCIQV
ncbi:MAG: PucR family transcriptional regulator, partial [Ruminococcus sp.]